MPQHSRISRRTQRRSRLQKMRPRTRPSPNPPRLRRLDPKVVLQLERKRLRHPQRVADHPTNPLLPTQPPKLPLPRRSRPHHPTQQQHTFPIPKIRKEQEGSHRRPNPPHTQRVQRNANSEGNLPKTLPRPPLSNEVRLDHAKDGQLPSNLFSKRLPKEVRRESYIRRHTDTNCGTPTHNHSKGNQRKSRFIGRRSLLPRLQK